MASVRLNEAAALASGWLIATVALRWLRDLPWSLATIAGFAIGVLVVVSWRTGRRVRSIHDREARWRRGDD